MLEGKGHLNAGEISERAVNLQDINVCGGQTFTEASMAEWERTQKRLLKKSQLRISINFYRAILYEAVEGVINKFIKDVKVGQ